MKPLEQNNTRPAAAFTVREFCEWSKISHSQFYKQVKLGLKIHKIGRKTIVKASDAQAWFEALPEAA